jgi:hypothetical protein
MLEIEFELSVSRLHAVSCQVNLRVPSIVGYFCHYGMCLMKRQSLKWSLK